MIFEQISMANHCNHCDSKKLVLESTKYLFVDFENEKEWEGDEEDHKVTCYDCEKEVER